MGRAGIALIEDPAALRLNPARLGALSFPQVSLDLSWQDADAVSGDSGLVATDPLANPFAGSTAATQLESDAALRPSFLGYAHPLEVMSRPLVVGISRTEALDVSLRGASSTTSIPVSAPIAPDSGVEATLVSDSAMDVSLALWDVGGGWRLTPSFSMGASLAVGSLDLDSRTIGSLADPLQLTGPGTTDPRFSTSDPQPLLETASSSGDTALAFSFGSWWKPAPTLGVAAVFRQGPRFDVDTATRDLADGSRAETQTRLRMPDTAAVGLVWTPFVRHPSSAMQSLTLVLDVESSSGAELTSDVVSGRNIHTGASVTRRATFRVDDETQARLGLELRRSLPSWTFAFRAGAYNERSPVVRRDDLEGDVSPLEGHAEALTEAGFFERPDTEIHGTLGFGAAFYALGFDLAVDASSSRVAVTASTSWRFGR